MVKVAVYLAAFYLVYSLMLSRDTTYGRNRVFNDDYQQMPLHTVTERARRSAVWLGEDVLRRSVPLPGRMRLRRNA